MTQLFQFKMSGSADSATNSHAEGLGGKSDSVRSEAESNTSFTSDDLNIEPERQEYTEAPDDVYYTDDRGVEVCVLKKGGSVPCETKYKKLGGTLAAKFG